ncbi:MAG: 4Fe-4S binding protein [bacterium]|nr:4Fe-4S binding protein [bacterium]
MLVALHIAHWMLTGRTLAPLEFNEVMFTFEHGLITAALILMVVTVLATLVFGRFFCGWACHLVALQDLCAWLLAKLNIRPRPLRSRLLFYVPFGVMLYTFLYTPARRALIAAWPAATEVVGTPPPFAFRIAAEGEQWESFVTTDFWRNLPGPVLTITTFLVCGFVLVYFLGSRSFCRYVCPYGAIFSLADRFAPGRILLTGHCLQCGHCTATCSSHVRVHEELARYGMVVDPGCFRDLDCTAVCPESAIEYGMRRPALFAQRTGPKRKRRPSLGRGDELLAVLVFAVTLSICTGFPESIAPWAGRLYSFMPLFLGASLALLTAFAVVHLRRLVLRPAYTLQGRVLRSGGRFRRPGVLFAVLAGTWLLVVIDSGLVQYHMFAAARATEHTRGVAVAALSQDATALAGVGEPVLEAARRGEEHLRRARTLGLLRDVRIDRRLAWLALVRGDTGSAVDHLRAAMEGEPDHPDTPYQLGRVLAVRGEHAEAARMLVRAQELGERTPGSTDAITRGVHQLVLMGRPDAALHVAREIMQLRPADQDLREALARVLEAGRAQGGG